MLDTEMLDIKGSYYAHTPPELGKEDVIDRDNASKPGGVGVNERFLNCQTPYPVNGMGLWLGRVLPVCYKPSEGLTSLSQGVQVGYNQPQPSGYVTGENIGTRGYQL